MVANRTKDNIVEPKLDGNNTKSSTLDLKLHVNSTKDCTIEQKLVLPKIVMSNQDNVLCKCFDDKQDALVLYRE